ncbi:metal-dependent hydrolase [Zunongwangia sp.]|uniref:metal-dependent hydrolase n=1 Tax=Zunongwangia sp. TaxID=1965325 RepID=UPI003AA80ADB
MDSLTQIVLGASVGEVVLGKKAGNKAMLYGAIAGTIPDLDILSNYFTDVITANEFHRGFTHSILFAVIFAPIFGWIISKIEKKLAIDWLDWTKLMFWGLFTHPLLDMFTTWGTELFWPANYRIAFKTIFVVDPLYTVPFLIFTILAACRPKGSLSRRKLNTVGLQLSCFYLFCVSVPLKLYADNAFQKTLDAQKIDYRDIIAKPTPFNTILWSANVDTKDAYLIGNYSVLDGRPISFNRYPKNRELAKSFKRYPDFRRLEELSKGWYTLTKEGDDIYFNDLRFGTLNPTNPDSEFVFRYQLKEKNGALQVTEVEKDRGDAKRMLRGLFKRMHGN